mmetsp:Transcript_16721/g.30406  ORF Transcript_16721/g.30406 Transcript_16721/m.30406 type:complete len:108 (-) Transcript_16721:688-1011(-)
MSNHSNEVSCGVGSRSFGDFHFAISTFFVVFAGTSQIGGNLVSFGTGLGKVEALERGAALFRHEYGGGRIGLNETDHHAKGGPDAACHMDGEPSPPVIGPGRIGCRP